MPLGVLVLLVSAIFGTWWFVDRDWQRSTMRQVQLATNQAALRLQGFIDARLSATSSLGGGLSAELIEPDTFRIRSHALQDNFGGYQALNWVDADGNIQVVVPEELNQGAIGKNVLNNELAGTAFLAARELGEPRLTAPLDLFQGGRGMAAYTPVYTDTGELKGMLNSVFRLSDLVDQSLSAGILDHYDVSIYDNKSLVYSTPPPGIGSRHPVARASVQLLNRQWILQASPNDALWATLQAGQQHGIYWFGLGMAVISVWFMRLGALRSWQRRQNEYERQELKLELERASKMQALGRLAGGVAHDFNNILTSIVGNAELVRRQSSKELTQALATDIIASADRAASLTKDLMSFSAPTQDEMSEVAVNEQVLDLHRMLTRLVPESAELNYELSPDVELANCSQTQLGQILVNLVVNACDAMPDGGKLLITTNWRPQPPLNPRMEVEGSQDGWCVLSVQDQGLGMNKATLDRIFEPFYSTKERGSGLGLATVYGIVRSKNGTVEISSEVGEGTTFEVWLPAIPNRHQSDNAPPPAGLLNPTRKWCVLFVEDNSQVREAMARTLRHLGMQIEVAKDGLEALQRLIQSRDDASGPDGQPNFDIVITDAIMPRLSGPKLLTRMRAEGISLPVVIVSGYSEELANTTYSPESNVHVLAKPYQLEDLLRVLEVIAVREGGEVSDPSNAIS